MNEQMRLFAIGIVVAIFGLLATAAAIGGSVDRRGTIASSELAVAEGVLLGLSADRQRFQFVDETPAAEATLKNVFGLTQPGDEVGARNIRLSCRLTRDLSGFAGFLQAGAHYRIHFLPGSMPCEVVRIQPTVAPAANAKPLGR